MFLHESRNVMNLSFHSSTVEPRAWVFSNTAVIDDYRVFGILLMVKDGVNDGVLTMMNVERCWQSLTAYLWVV